MIMPLQFGNEKVSGYQLRQTRLHLNP